MKKYKYIVDKCHIEDYETCLNKHGESGEKLVNVGQEIRLNKIAGTQEIFMVLTFEITLIEPY